MERTKTGGIYIDATGNRIVDKWFKGERINARLGKVSQQSAEAWLAERINQARTTNLFGADPRKTFREAVLKHLTEARERLADKFGTNEEGVLHSKAQKQLDDTAWHIDMIDPFIGTLWLEEINNDTLKPFVTKRKKDGVKPRTIAITLQRVGRILNKAAREWADKETRRPWLRQVPPKLRLPLGQTRPPFPFTRDEERRLFSGLPKHIAEMCLFKINTGLREDEVCNLQWKWERKVDNGVSVFIIPPENHKGGDYENYRLVVPNSLARAVIETQRGKHAEFVFISPMTQRPLKDMNNNPFQRARRLAGLTQCRIHDLMHTFGERLKAAGVPHELRQVLLGHKNENVTTHYSRARLNELFEAAEKVLTVNDCVSVVRIIGGVATESPTKVPQTNNEGHPKVA